MIDTTLIPFPPSIKDVAEEPDWSFIDYMDELERQWQADLQKTLPKNYTEWLEIFPEAEAIIPDKIKEWEEVATNAIAAVREVLQNIKTKVPEKDVWFHRELLKHTSPAVHELAFAKKRIKQLRFLLPNTQGERGRAKWQRVLDHARGCDLVSVAQTYGLKLRKTGRTFTSLCPHHNERGPSFHIYPPSRFVCFGCNVKGDVIAFIQLMDKCSFKKAVYKLQKI